MARVPPKIEPDAAPSDAASTPADATAGVSAMLVALGSDMARLLDHLTRRHGSLSYSQYQLLTLLRSTHPEPWEPWEIGKRLGTGSAHVTMLIDQLERGGHVIRETHAQDRRRRLVRLAPNSLERVEMLHVQVRRAESHVLGSALNAEELERLGDMGQRVRAVLGEFTAPDLSFLLGSEPGRY